jgi:hypothetical protein
MATPKYDASNIRVLEGLDNVRQKYDVIELSKKIKRQGDILILSKELKIRLRSLKSAVEEGRILSFFPNIHKSKVNALSRLKTNRELIKFSNMFNLSQLSVRTLYKRVLKWNKEIQINPKLLVSDEEHDIILGTLLGDASVRQRQKNSCLRFSHSIKQRDYCEWKFKIFNKFKISEFREVRRKINERSIHAIDFSTKTHPVFNYYRNLFYKNGIKKVTKKLLDQLNPRSLAIWICDDGSYSVKQGYMILCTNSFSLEEHKLMKDFFNEKFNLNPKIGFRDGKYYYLRFRKEDSEKLIKLIKPFIPKSMVYKIGGTKQW